MADAVLEAALLLVCCAEEFADQAGSDSDAGDPTALPVRFESSAAPASEAGGEELSVGDAEVKPKALRAEKRPLLENAPPKLVRRGGCESKAFVTGCDAVSELCAALVLVGAKKN